MGEFLYKYVTTELVKSTTNEPNGSRCSLTLPSSVSSSLQCCLFIGRWLAIVLLDLVSTLRQLLLLRHERDLSC